MFWPAVLGALKEYLAPETLFRPKWWEGNHFIIALKLPLTIFAFLFTFFFVTVTLCKMPFLNSIEGEMVVMMEEHDLVSQAPGLNFYSTASK